MASSFLNRDLSWLSFNARVLLEAGNDTLPILERLQFLSIFSSNLDEFYRVRIPALMALSKIDKEKDEAVLEAVNETIHQLQEQYGKILHESILPSLTQHDIFLFYNRDIPDFLLAPTKDYFFTKVLSFIQPVLLTEATDFFPENNLLYLCVRTKNNEGEQLYLVNIPGNQISRFLSITEENAQYIFFIDDIIKSNLSFLFPHATILEAFSFKVTRDAELDLADEYRGDIAEKIEKQISKRDYGFATRFLYEPTATITTVQQLVAYFGLSKAMLVAGGRYHHLRDIGSIPIKNNFLSNTSWPAATIKLPDPNSLFGSMEQKDLIVHTPYQRYDEVLRFFNEAANDEGVEEIYLTFYRIAADSRIAHALISAAKNGRKVTVFVELKARFDEENNIRWAKRMKAAGIRIVYSIPGLKVHAKVALVKKKTGERVHYYGLLSTGNFNETTARFYTDHILFTTNKEIMRELELLFLHLVRRKKPESKDLVHFDHLLVAQFNLLDRFLELIDREIILAKNGRPGRIQIKLNNLEERRLIEKLYEASKAGVKIELIVRSICCIDTPVVDQSENILVKRIVDRYLEHGRLFIFHNGGNEEVFLGSADWMNRNIYRRIEVCFPVYDEVIKKELIHLFHLQWNDNVKAVFVDASLSNQPVAKDGEPNQSQQTIYQWLNKAL